MSVLVTKGLTVTHPLADHPAVVDVSIRLEEGRIYGLLGKNGAGKTTLCNTVRGLIPKLLGGSVEGSVELMDAAIDDLDAAELATRVGYVFENPFTQLTGSKSTVVEEIAFGLENLGWDRQRMIERVADVLTELNLQELAFRDPLQLSGGQRQRVALASVIAMDAPVLVIDEPTSQLDPATSAMIFEILSAMRDRGKTVLLAENKLDDVVRIADELIVLDGGRLVCQAEPGEALQEVIRLGIDCGLPELYDLGTKLRPGSAWKNLDQASHELGLQLDGEQRKEIQ